MVRILIGLRATIAGHTWQRSSKGLLVSGLVLGLASSLGTLALGVFSSSRPCDILAAAFALWIGGRLAQSALEGGDAGLRPEVFSLLPLGHRRLAWSLLVVSLADPVLVLSAVAFAALLPVASGRGADAIVVAVVAVVLTVVLTSVASTVVGGLLGPGARRGRDLGTVVAAVALSALALAGTLAPPAFDALEHGRSAALVLVVRLLPSGWGPDAVAAAAGGRTVPALGWLAALVVLTAAVALVWPALLRRRMTLAPATHRGPGGRVRRRGVLPATPAGAVCAKELRSWARDPIRISCLLIAVSVGVGVAVVPRLTAHTGLLLPFAGPLTVIIAGACASNLYGNDGAALWLAVGVPGAARADVTGRVLAWLLVVAPFAGVETVVLTALSDRPDLWPWALAALVALLGGAAGLVPVLSLVSVQPLDDAGNPTPGWSVKVHLALLVVTATAGPALAVLVLGTSMSSRWLVWAALPVAVVSGGAVLVLGTRWARRRLEATQVALLARLVAA